MTRPARVSPQRISDECFCLNLRRAARALSRRYDDALRPLDLNNGQFSMLASIAGLQPVAILMLADHLAMDRTTVTAALKPLRRRGLVEVAVAPNDLRSREASLTAEGQALLVEAARIWDEAQAGARRRLTMAGAERLREQLRVLA